MMRFSVRVAFGLIVTLSMSSIAAAQIVSGVTKARDPLLSRAFRGITFGAPVPAPRPNPMPRVYLPPLPNTAHQPNAMPRIDPTPRPDAAPRANNAPPCVMRVVPVDPRVTSGMPIVSVDERPDPKIVVKVPACQPRD